MLDIKWIREHAKEFDDSLSRRGLTAKAHHLINFDNIRREAITLAQEIKTHRNRLAKEIGNLKSQDEDATEIMTQIGVLREKANDNEIVFNQNIDMLIRENKIDSKMASSLINDVGFTHSISKKLLKTASVLWIKDEEIKELGDEYEY